MNAGLALVVALLSLAEDPAPDALRVRARPELPWVVAVAAYDGDVEAAVAERLVTPGREAIGALLAKGGRARTETIQGRVVVVVEGPPDAHDLVVAAARSARLPGFALVVFVDGRTTLSDVGRLPPRKPGKARAAAPLAPGHALVPDASLLDVEGEALRVLLEDALKPIGRVSVDVKARREDARLVVDTADRARAKEALDIVVNAPPSPRVIESVRARAKGRIAERRARAGGWARDQAALYVAFGVGSGDVEEPATAADLGTRLRARVFPALLVR